MTTSHTDVIGNRALAARARAIGSQAARGSLQRKAALCAAIALDETRTIAAARKVLDDLADPAIAQAAAELIGELAGAAGGA